MVLNGNILHVFKILGCIFEFFYMLLSGAIILIILTMY